jgi:hypothetical protein
VTLRGLRRSFFPFQGEAGALLVMPAQAGIQ